MKSGGILLMALTATGCAAVDQKLLTAETPVAPAEWSASADASADTQSALGAPPTGDWVAAFNDPALTSLITEALKHNRNLGAAYARLEASHAAAVAARAGLFPTLGANFTYSRNAIVVDPTAAAQAGSGGAGSAQRIFIDNFRLGGQLQWEPDVWRRVKDQSRAAYKDANAQAADVAGAELSLAGSVAQSWYGLIQARLLRELSERDVEARADSLRITERRYSSGVATSLDVRLARSALASSQATQASREQAEKEAARALEVLLGRYPDAEVTAADALPALHHLQGAGAPGDLLARRPDLVASELRLESAGLRARAARKQLLPSITLTTNAGTSGPNLADLIDPTRLAGALATGLSQPLFQGGRLLAQSKQARSNAQAAIYDYAQTILDAYREAENALTAEDLLSKREDALKIAFDEAVAAQDITERRYNSGTATIFELLDSQTRRISAEQQYIQATGERLTNRVRLYLAIGGDFLPDHEPRTAAADRKGATDKEGQS